MNWIIELGSKLGLALLSALPVERIVAALLNRLLDKIAGGSFDKASKTAAHLIELAELFNRILADQKLTAEEVNEYRLALADARKDLLALWASGSPSKDKQAIVRQIEAIVTPPYNVDTALHSSQSSGFATPGCVCALAAMLVCASLLAGCLTRTRCQTVYADQVTVNVHLNDPDTLAENALPRSIQILAQEQMIEGGTDTIASGNKTPITAQLPVGDTAVSALGSLLGGAIKGAVAPAKASTNAAADCADGSCQETQ